MVPKRNRRAFIKTALVSTAGAGPIAAAFAHSDTSTKKSSAPVTLRSTGPNPYRVDLGIGFNWFEHFGAGGHYARWINYPLSTKIYPSLDDTPGWNAIEQGLDELQVGWIRFGMPPDPHVDTQGRFVKGTIHFKHLERLNQWAVKRDRTILLDMFLMPRHYEFPVPDGTLDPGDNIVNMAAENNRAYARSFVVPMMEYVINELKLDAVTLFNPINEPMEYGVFQTPGNVPPAMAHYVDMYRELRSALDEAGFTRDRLALIGLDCGNPTRFTLEQHALGVDIDPYVSAYSVHHYNLRLDHLPPQNLPDTGRHYFIKGMNVVIEQDDKQFVNYARSRNKPLWALEMGTFYYGKFSNPQGVASLDATITVAEGIIRALNCGITAFCIWSLLNSNDVDGHWAVMGHKDGQLVRHGYPFAVYGLLGRHLQPGATVIPLAEDHAPEIQHVHATCLENEGGHRAVMMVNDHPDESVQVTVKLPDRWDPHARFTAFLVDRNHLNVAIDPITASRGCATVSCPPLSLIGLMNAST